MSRYRLSDLAKADLLSIVAEIKARRPKTAQRVKNRLLEVCRFLARMPEAGSVHEDIDSPDLKTSAVFQYVIVYRRSAKPLEIVRILHGHRDFKGVDFSR